MWPKYVSMGSRMNELSKCMVVLMGFVHGLALAVAPIAPVSDDEVVEVLAQVTRYRPIDATSAHRAPDPLQAAAAAREAIARARQTGEARYWGHAQGALGPWWDRADAPVELAVLQATVQQGRHAFDAARTVLESALQRHPEHAQGWLTLASLNRLSARYAHTLSACDAVERAGQPFYAQACRLETWSLQGRHTSAAQGLQHLLARSAAADQRSWLWSLLAESHERAGHDHAAQRAYQNSLALGEDLYTAIAYSDLLLRTGQPLQTLAVLAKSPATDAVLLRRAVAWKRLGDVRWQWARTTLRERTAELLRRGDDPSLHGRELALAALWLDDDPVQAVGLARANLLLQREPLDYWVAAQSAHRAKDPHALAEFAHGVQAVGLMDQRLFSTLGTATAMTTNTPRS